MAPEEAALCRYGGSSQLDVTGRRGSDIVVVVGGNDGAPVEGKCRFDLRQVSTSWCDVVKLVE